MKTETETTVGKLWTRESDDGSKYLGGVLLQPIEPGTHVRLRKNRNARSKRDGEYLLVAVTEEKTSRKRTRKRSEPLPPENPMIHSFVPDDDYDYSQFEVS